ncbi:YrhB domain-containing protein [Kitasatospora sp. NPDC001159]
MAVLPSLRARGGAERPHLSGGQGSAGERDIGGPAISRGSAVERVESLLAGERLAWARPVPESAVQRVEERKVGRLVFWDAARCARTRYRRDNLVGSGPYLVDRHDGSIHHVPVTT